MQGDGLNQPIAALPKLVGECNQCGLCCFVWGYACINLIVKGIPGQPMATRCGVRGLRYDGMPIKLVDMTGRIVGESKCALESPAETFRVVQEIGRGCSLKALWPKRKTKGGTNAVKAHL